MLKFRIKTFKSVHLKRRKVKKCSNLNMVLHKDMPFFGSKYMLTFLIAV